jgi:hypothetical protein
VRFRANLCFTRGAGVSRRVIDKVVESTTIEVRSALIGGRGPVRSF